jgi:TonB family protein
MSKPLVFKVDGSQVGLGERIGRGGEGEVYALANDNGHAVKIYSGSGGADRREKISAMVSAKLSERTPLAAFPIHTVQKRNGDFAGFIMRKISGHKPLFELYAPGARKNNFLHANYPFLVQTALNFANAVGAVHSTGCVIGDINHSGILIADNAIVSLIDADSFQVVEGPKRYLCRVGVPDYTPPELQGTKLNTVLRTINHDNFGLAIVIFQLLFMGRHPFSGYYQHGEMPIERAIGEHRFVYATKRNVGMKPPPAAPLLKHFPPNVGAAFEAAFGPAPTRPDPRQWIGVLRELNKSLRSCKDDPLHHYWQGAPECPWCRMERLQGITLFLSPAAAPPAPGMDGISSGSFKLDVVWRAVEAAIPPGGGALSPILHPVAPHPTAEAETLRGEATQQRLLGVASAGAAVAILFANPALWILWVPAGWFGLAQLFGKAADVGKLRSQKRDLEQRWRQALGDWEKRCSSDGFNKIRSELFEAKKSYQGLSAEQAQRIAKYQQNRRNIQLKAYLSTFYIRHASIRGIGQSKTATLASYGIETAADVISTGRIEQVPGFGPATALNLLTWRRAVESRFVYNANPNRADQVELTTIKAEIAKRESQLRQQLIAGPASLIRATQDALARRRSVDPALQQLHERIAQVDADLRHVHGKAGNTIAWLAGIIVAVTMLVALMNADWSTEQATAPSEGPTAVSTNRETDAPAASSSQPTIPAPDEVTASDIAGSQMLYAVRVTNVRARPSTGTPIVGKLERGTAVQGVVAAATDTEKRWLKITAGPYAGYYASAEANLSTEPRPELDTAYSGLRTVIHTTSALASPTWDASVVRELEQGIELEVVGRTENGFAEVSLKNGAIVYVDISSLAEPDAPAASDEQPLDSSDVEADAIVAQATSPAVPTQSLASLLTDADYPDAAIRADEEGRTAVRLEVDQLGRVSSCSVEQSSGSSYLDEATCRLMTRRARFSPAKNANGDSVTGTYFTAITWELP